MALVTTNFAELALWVMRRRKRIVVSGASMEPTLVEGAHIFVDRQRVPEVGSVVVARHPDGKQLIVKRVVEIFSDRSCDLRSDNAAVGTDSRVWGPVDAGRIIGVVSSYLPQKK